MRHTSRKTIVNAKQCTLLNQHIKPTHCRRYRGVNATPRIGTIKQHVLAVALTIVCAICFSSTSAAATNGPQQTRTYHLDLPEQTVATALNSLSEQTDIQVLFPYDIAAQLRSEPLLGRFSIELALERLLRDTGLHGGLTSSGVITISQTGSESTTNQNGKGKRMNIKNSTKRKTLLAGLVGLFAAGGTAQVAAQGGEAATSQSAIDEIIVTATKRAESLNDTALSIAAIGGEEISRRNISGMQDYLSALPSVNMLDQGPGYNFLVVRGIAVSPEGEGGTSGSSVGSYFGESPVGGLGLWGGSADPKLVDMERVEFLRGPQGTLYGSSALSGALRNIPNKPDLETLGGNIKATYSSMTNGGGNNSKVEGVINVPLVEDVLAIRAVAFRHYDSGYIDNIVESDPVLSEAAITLGAGNLVANQSDLGATEYEGGRISALWKASENLTIDLKYVTQDGEQKGQPWILIDDPGYTISALQFGGVFGEGKNEGISDDLDFTNLVAEYDLGWGTILSSSTWLEQKFKMRFDATVFFTPFIPFGFRTLHLGQNTSNTDAFMQEVRLVSQLDGPLDYLIGVYYEDIDSNQPTETHTGGDENLGLDYRAPNFPGSTLVSRTFKNLTTEQKAVFGELSYDLSDTLELTLGMRWFDYDREREFESDLGAAGGLPFSVAKVSESDTSFKANLSYRPNDDTLIYGQWSEGFRLGGLSFSPINVASCDADNDGLLDGTNVSISESFDSDSLENFELGIKASMMDNRLQVNASVYHINWDGTPTTVQASATPTCFSPLTFNAEGSESQGVEIESTYYVSPNLRLGFGGSYKNAELSADTPEVFALKGDRLPGSADYNLYTSVQYEFDLSGYDAYINGHYSYVGTYFFDLHETGTELGGYEQLSLSAGVTIDNVSVELFANNVTNADEVTWLGDFPDNRGFRLKPRTIGLNVAYQF